jgi:peptidyl-prolyl cis-trans isomerase C
MSEPLIQFGKQAEGPVNGAIPAARVKVPAPPRPASSTVSVDGVVIAHAAISAEAQQHPAATPAEAFRLATEALVVRQLLLNEAERLGLAPTPERDDRGRQETEEDAMIRALLDTEVTTPTAGEAESRRYYDTHQDRFSTGDMWEAHHILLPVPNGAGEEEVQEVEHLAQLITRQLMEAPGRFAELALTHSACPSREVGGSLGQLTPGSTVPEFETALGTLAAGEVTREPVRSRFGFHIIRLDRCIPGRRLPFEMVRERIALHLEASSWSRGVAQLIGVLADRAKIVGITLSAMPHLSGGRG